jgi:hypothetical protein
VHTEYNLTKIDVYSMNGQFVETINLASENSSLKLSNGTYLLKKYIGTRKVLIKK